MTGPGWVVCPRACHAVVLRLGLGLQSHWKPGVFDADAGRRVVPPQGPPAGTPTRTVCLRLPQSLAGGFQGQVLRHSERRSVTFRDLESEVAEHHFFHPL